ncbi:MAG: hypothetical protein AB1568_00505 [Thermodesulfobacteriota bacterium]
MNTREFCTNLNRELEGWRTRLEEVSNRFDEVPSLDKYRLTPHIEGLHILLTEMDDRIAELAESCPVGEWNFGEDAVGEPSFAMKEERGVHHDYDFGG